MSHGLKFGATTGIAMGAYLAVLCFTGLLTVMLLPALSYLLLIGGIVMAHLACRKAEGSMGYGKAVGIGAITSAIASLLSQVIYFISLAMSPGVIEDLKDRQAGLLERFNAPPEAVQAAMERVSPLQMAVGGFVTILIIGVVLTLIIAAFTRKKAKA